MVFDDCLAARSTFVGDCLDQPCLAVLEDERSRYSARLSFSLQGLCCRVNLYETTISVCRYYCRFLVYTCLPDGRADKSSEKVQLYSRTKTMRQICADVKSSLNLTPKVDTRLSLKKLEVDQGGILRRVVSCHDA